jgi:hypothetical protein
MISFQTTIQKFKNKAEKSGWTYILIPKALSEKINPGVKKSYRIKGKLDNHSFSGLNLLPIGEGDFILALNATIRKAIHKKQGDPLDVCLDLDTSNYILNSELMLILETEPAALSFFKSLAKSHQNYFSKWIESAKTTETRHERIAATVNAMIKKQNYAEMIRDRKSMY